MATVVPINDMISSILFTSDEAQSRNGTVHFLSLELPSNKFVSTLLWASDPRTVDSDVFPKPMTSVGHLKCSLFISILYLFTSSARIRKPHLNVIASETLGQLLKSTKVGAIVQTSFN